jgi:predicted ATPase
MYFKKLKISNWQQFGEVDLDFHQKLTILTGANGSGKTTLLNLLARHYNWQHQNLAVPHKDKTTGAFRFLARMLQSETNKDSQIGSIEYGNGTSTPLSVPEGSNAQYQVNMLQQQSVECFFIPSHRSVFRYQALTQIPIGFRDKLHAFNVVSQSVRNRYFGGQETSSSYHMKEILIAWNIFGRGNQDMTADATQLSYYTGFESVLKNILPETLGFKKLSLRSYEVILECESGDFMIDAASGGLSTIIDMAWQIYMYNKNGESEFTVLIDEIENHLHPTMQRRILLDLINAFPNVRFIVSTHSPLIISSTPDSNVYALRYKNGRINSELLDFTSKTHTATQILDEVLGVSTTIPIWVEQKLQTLLTKLSSSGLNQAAFKQLRVELEQLGLAQYMPQALTEIVVQHDKAE